MPKAHIKKLTTSLEFYKKNYYFLLYTAIFFGIVIFGMTSFAIYRQLNIPAQQYFATTSDGNIIELFDIRDKR